MLKFQLRSKNRRNIDSNKKFFLSFLLLFSLNLYGSKSFAIFDYAAAKAEDLGKVAIYADAVADLLAEVTPDSSAEKSAQDLRDQNRKLSSDMYDLYFLGEDTKSFLEGPDLSHERLDMNIRSGTNYIRRGKRIIAQMAVLGSNGLIGMNGIQTNLTLNEIQKNQAVLIAQNERRDLMTASREIQDAREWQNFILSQRQIRKAHKIKTRLIPRKS